VKPKVWAVRFPGAQVIGATIGLALGSTAGVALAQPLMPLMGDVMWPGLKQDDIDRMHAAGERLYEGGSIGTVERWRNPDSKNAGEVKLTRSFEAQGMPCRTLEYTVRFDVARTKPSRYVINWCKTQSGDWKIVELPRSSR
jgi:surface antigen